VLVIGEVLNAAELAALRDAIAALRFADGAATAGRHARQVKANDQAAPSPDLDAIRTKITRTLAANPVFASAARPRALTPPIVSRYRTGQTYGSHVDDAIMGGLRTDLSYTLFLSDPDDYDGGALAVEDRMEEREIKLAAGDLVLYPSTTLHRVVPVTRGERIAVVGWVQSLVRDAGQREILFDLDRAIDALFDASGKTEVLDRLTRTRSNLLRMWAEP
jgi:PKHD-type hydroxylase